MEISRKLPAVQPKTKAGPGRPNNDGTAGSVPAAVPKDRVHLSSKARQLIAAQAAIRNIPDVDLDKVAETKAKIKAGHYTVDPQKTASKMLAESLLETESLLENRSRVK